MSELLNINVNEHTEKKNGLTYLSWAWAWTEVLKIDPQATWEAQEFDGFPASFAPDGSAMVKVMVTIKAHTKTCWLPVMNHANKAIKNPDAFAINTAIVRCLTKCIGMFGLGLYIYAGEDIPQDETKGTEEEAYDADDAFEAEHLPRLEEAAQAGLKALEAVFQSLPKSVEKTKLWSQHSAALKAKALAAAQEAA